LKVHYFWGHFLWPEIVLRLFLHEDGPVLLVRGFVARAVRCHIESLNSRKNGRLALLGNFGVYFKSFLFGRLFLLRNSFLNTGCDEEHVTQAKVKKYGELCFTHLGG
jgi:hypothetical protein